MTNYQVKQALQAEVSIIQDLCNIAEETLSNILEMAIFCRIDYSSNMYNIVFVNVDGEMVVSPFATENVSNLKFYLHGLMNSTDFTAKNYI